MDTNKILELESIVEEGFSTIDKCEWHVDSDISIGELEKSRSAFREMMLIIKNQPIPNFGLSSNINEIIIQIMHAINNSKREDIVFSIEDVIAIGIIMFRITMIPTYLDLPANNLFLLARQQVLEMKKSVENDDGLDPKFKQL